MRVLKFGGSSVANVQRIENVCQLIANQAQTSTLTVVLSAPKGVTDMLVELAQLSHAGDEYQQQLTSLADFMSTLVGGFSEALDESAISQLNQFVSAKLDRIGTLLEGAKLLQHCPDHVKAQITSCGEHVSAQITTALLNKAGFDAVVLDPTQCIRAKGDYQHASADMEATTAQMREVLANNKAQIYILPGFIAANKQGQLCTLGRNGSDYSAAIIASCIGAEVCEIWTDVDGVYSADPRMVKDAILIEQLSYKEAMELSYFGAKVLHPKTIRPLALSQIPCVIKNTLSPEQPGTLINNESQTAPVAKALSCLEDLTVMTVSGAGVKQMVGMVSRVFATLAKNDIAVVLTTQSSSEMSISFCIYQESAKRAKEALENEFELELENDWLNPVALFEDVAIVSLVGDGMQAKKGTAAKFFASLAQARVNIVAIAQDSSEGAISAVIERKYHGAAIKVCHENFFTHVPSIDLFVVGCGVVGSEFINQVEKQRQMLDRRNIRMRVYGIANSQNLLLDSAGMALKDWQQRLPQAEQGFSLDNLAEFVKNNHLINPVLVDCTSSDYIAKQYVDFLAAGFHVVTPNKKANTDSMEYYQQLRKTALSQKRRFLYETTVGAGLPVIDTLQGLFNAGDQMVGFEGILSGSLSYIFGKLDEGMTISQATSIAKDNGFTEPDPRDDLSGMDVARKLLIMAREAGIQIELDDIEVESLLPPSFDDSGSVEQFMQNLEGLDNVYRERIQQAKDKGQVLRYVGKISGDKCSVSVLNIDSDNALYNVKDGENALAITSLYYQPIPFVIRGYGAGAEVTAAGVFADTLRTLSWQQEV